MVVQIPETGVIKKQKLDIAESVSIIYGYNNCGKTTVLKALDTVFRNRLMEKFILGQEGEMCVYIPTNRIVVSEHTTEEVQLRDCEEFIHYQKDSYMDYSLHLKRLRDSLLANAFIYCFICQAVYDIFEIDIKGINSRFSDGIENIINIYLNIIWAMVWDMDITCMKEELLHKLLSQKRIYVLIDEIEMFLHVNIQSKLISNMRKDFSGCNFILTTHSPILLTRYKQCIIYKIRSGRLKKIEEDMYYEDLDIIYEQLFDVEELPPKARKSINFLGDVIMGKGNIDSEKIFSTIADLRKEYPNLCRRYNAVITKAQYVGENHGRS